MYEVRIEVKLNQGKDLREHASQTETSGSAFWDLQWDFSLSLSNCVIVFINNRTKAERTFPVHCSFKKQQLACNWHETVGFGRCSFCFASSAVTRANRRTSLSTLTAADTQPAGHQVPSMTTARKGMSGWLLQLCRAQISQKFCHILDFWSICILSGKWPD